jgi:hypothetical protein
MGPITKEQPVFLILTFCLAAPADPPPAKVKLPELHKEIQARVKTDQDARYALIAFTAKHKMTGKPGTDLALNVTREYEKLNKRMQEIDEKNTAWLKGVVEKHGWPGESLVGTDGAHRAWLLVQHADRDRDFQEQCLKKMEALPAGEVDRRDIAYLTDRVLVGQGKKQKYGTQAQFKDGKAVPLPIEDESGVDKRRKEAGLEPLAQYLKQMEKVYTQDRSKGKERNKEVERLNLPAKLILQKATVLFLLRAEGVQIYKGVKKDGKLQWTLEGPRAVLLNYGTGEKVGTHSKGPVWEGSDGSKVQGKLVASEPAANAGAIPRLLLEAKSAGGTGRFANVTYIARVDTWAGQAPAKPPEKAGVTKEVRYHATYVFFGSVK